jgi:hypothetical protein
VKKKEKQEEVKRKDKSLPVYDYDNKFNYKKGYLRDDRVPAFISTKQNSRKEELVESSIIEIK